MGAIQLKLLNRLKMKHLSLLVAIADSGNLHQAAEAVSIAQPSASKVLADLESLFGFSIFERHSRGMQPTALGSEVISYARECLADLAAFTENLEIKQKGGHGLLLVGIIMGAVPDILARAVADLKIEKPRLNIRIFGETSDQVVNLLKLREIDLAVGRFTDPLQHNEFEFESLTNESLRLVVRAQHPLASKRKINLSDLPDWPWILQSITTPARQILEEEFAHRRLSTPANIVECSSIFASLQLLQAYDAIAMLPESVVRDSVKAKLLVELPIEIGKDIVGFGLLTRKREVLSEPGQRLAVFLRKYSKTKVIRAKRNQRRVSGTA